MLLAQFKDILLYFNTVIILVQVATAQIYR